MSRGWIQSCCRICHLMCKQKVRYIIRRVKCHTESLLIFWGFIYSCLVILLAVIRSHLQLWVEHRWKVMERRGVRSSASLNIKSAQPTHSCADQESLRRVLQNHRTGRSSDGSAWKSEKTLLKTAAVVQVWWDFGPVPGARTAAGLYRFIDDI